MEIYLPIFLLLLGISSSIGATNITIYRWIDKNNVVHFSQKQPDNNNYTTLSMASTKPYKKVTTKNDSATVAVNKAELALKNNNKKCLIAQTNLNTLKNFDKIQYKNDSGEAKILPVKEKNDQIILNKNQVKLYCNEELQ